MRKLASVQIIKSIESHPNADRLEIATVQGWQCVVKKGEFQAGDKCVYFEIDSKIPMKHEWIRFLQDKNNPQAPARLKTIKLRGEISQGLALPLSILDGSGADPSVQLEGDDLTEYLGIEKYEPEIPACLGGDVRGARPSYTIKTDSERIQAFPELINEFQDKLVYISQKIDGTSGTYSFMDGDFQVSGRNWSYKEGDNTYWKIAKKYDIENKLKEISGRSGKNYAIQGECYGEGIQKNRLGIKGHDLAVFDVYDIGDRMFLGLYEFKEFCERLSLKTVPILQICEFKFKTIDELLELAKGEYVSGRAQEGIVIRPVHPFNSAVLGGRASFKVINNDFLLKDGE